jgi:exonuclease III
VDYRDAEGRVLRVSFKDQHNHSWAVVVVYAPVLPADRPTFFGPLGAVEQALRSGSADTPVIMAGDFNCITSAADMFVPAHQNNTHRFTGASELTARLQQSSLIDAYRCMYPNTPQITKIASNGNGDTAARTSRWYMPENMCQGGWIREVRSDFTTFPGDHATVSLQLNTHPGHNKGQATGSYLCTL